MLELVAVDEKRDHVDEILWKRKEVKPTVSNSCQRRNESLDWWKRMHDLSGSPRIDAQNLTRREDDETKKKPKNKQANKQTKVQSNTGRGEATFIESGSCVSWFRFRCNTVRLTSEPVSRGT